VLESGDLGGSLPSPENRVEFGLLIEWKLPLLQRRLAVPGLGALGTMGQLPSLCGKSLFIAIKEWFEAHARSEGRRAGA
jgi:hypothetical protein